MDDPLAFKVFLKYKTFLENWAKVNLPPPPPRSFYVVIYTHVATLLFFSHIDDDEDDLKISIPQRLFF